MRTTDDLMNDIRVALETAESNGFQRGFAAGLKVVEKAIAVARDGSVLPASSPHGKVAPQEDPREVDRKDFEAAVTRALERASAKVSGLTLPYDEGDDDDAREDSPQSASSAPDLFDMWHGDGCPDCVAARISGGK